MNTRFQATIHGMLAVAMLAGGTTLFAATAEDPADAGTRLLRAVQQAGRDLHADYGNFGVLGTLFGARLQVPVAVGTCSNPASEEGRCRHRG